MSDARTHPTSDAAPIAPADGDVASLVDQLRLAAGPALTLVVHFGSTRSQAAPDGSSAHDLFVVTREYGAFYRRLQPIAAPTRRPRLLAFLNRCLPPNLLYLPASGTAGGKLFVISEADLERELSTRARDHFCRARLIQDTRIAWARDDVAASRFRAQVKHAREDVPEWMRSRIDGPFGIDGFCREMMRLSYGSEIRPESGDRAGEVFGAQRDFLAGVFRPILQESAEIEESGDLFQYRRRATWRDHLRARWFFSRSKVRATLRWTKYTLTFDGWLDYIVAKVRRRTGLSIELTPRQRRWPFLFLWPEFWRVLRARRTSSR